MENMLAILMIQKINSYDCNFTDHSNNNRYVMFKTAKYCCDFTNYFVIHMNQQLLNYTFDTEKNVYTLSRGLVVSRCIKTQNNTWGKS